LFSNIELALLICLVGYLFAKVGTFLCTRTIDTCVVLGKSSPYEYLFFLHIAPIGQTIKQIKMITFMTLKSIDCFILPLTVAYINREELVC
jgi:hypothetical protein